MKLERDPHKVPLFYDISQIKVKTSLLDNIFGNT